MLLQEPGRKDRLEELVARGLVNALDALHARYFANICENAFELAAVGDFQTGFDASVEAVRTAFEIANVGAGGADNRGNLGEQTGAIPGANRQLHRKCSSTGTTPFDGDASFRLVHQILNIGTSPSVNRNTAATGDITNDFVTGNRDCSTWRERREDRRGL